MKNKQCPNCKSYKTYSMGGAFGSAIAMLMFSVVITYFIPIIGIILIACFSILALQSLTKFSKWKCKNCKHEF